MSSKATHIVHWFTGCSLTAAVQMCKMCCQELTCLKTFFLFITLFMNFLNSRHQLWRAALLLGRSNARCQWQPRPPYFISQWQVASLIVTGLAPG